MINAVVMHDRSDGNRNKRVQCMSRRLVVDIKVQTPISVRHQFQRRGLKLEETSIKIEPRSDTHFPIASVLSDLRPYVVEKSG